LIEQGLEEVKVAAIDQSHIDRGALELLRRVEPGEAASQNYDPVILCYCEGLASRSFAQPGHWR
jgi:hypothetical protein